MPKKIYVLDTNILMQTNGSAISGFDDNMVVITHTTLEELDHHKNDAGERGFSARESIRRIEAVVQNNENCTSEKGIKMSNGGLFRIDTNGHDELGSPLPEGWDKNHPDNRILTAVKHIMQRHPKTEVHLITNDVSLRVKATACKIPTQGYFNEQVSNDKAYTGRVEILVPKNIIDNYYKDNEINISEISSYSNEPIYENEFIMLIDETNLSHTALGWNRNGFIQPIDDKKTTFGVTPHNVGQRFAMQALLAPASEIPLVVIKGPAGSGKTMISMAAAMDSVYDSKKDRKYDNIVITRGNSLPEKEDLGFLPGDLEEKMGPLLAPFFDNLKVLLRQGTDESLEQITMQAEDLIDTGVVEICSLAYIRGRSMPNTFFIVDEAQNLSVGQIKTLVTRMGTNAKLVLLGDPDQIDNPKLDKRNNGLSYLCERFKGKSSLVAICEMKDEECLRSPLASLGIKEL